MDWGNYIRIYSYLHSPDQVESMWGVHSYPDGQNQFWIKDTLADAVYRIEASVVYPVIMDLVQQIGQVFYRKSIEKYALYQYGSRCDQSLRGDTLVGNVAQLYWADTSWESLVPHYKSAGVFCKLPIDWDQYDAVIGADANAITRYGQAIPERLKRRFAEKVREPSGQIKSLSLPHIDRDWRCLVIDDICDGGATFEMLAADLEGRKPAKLDLLVMHGVFSNGGDARVANLYDQVYVSNSYVRQGHLDKRLKVFNVWGEQMHSIRYTP